MAKPSSDLIQQIIDTANQYGVPPALFTKLVQIESGFNPNAVSNKGAIGYTQLMPSTAAGLGVDPNDPTQNLQGGASYLAQMYSKKGSWYDALVAYNAGPNASGKGLAQGQTYADMFKSVLGIGGTNALAVTTPSSPVAAQPASPASPGTSTGVPGIPNFPIIGKSPLPVTAASPSTNTDWGSILSTSTSTIIWWLLAALLIIFGLWQTINQTGKLA